MKVLLTGGTGYLGKQLANQLIARGNDLVVLKRSSSDMSHYQIENLAKKVELVDVDKFQLAHYESDFGQFDAVIHAATCYGRNGESFEELERSNNLWPLSLLQAVPNDRDLRFVNVGTSLPSFTNPYALSKRHFKDWGKYISQSKALSFINVELEHFYGPFDAANKFPSWIIRSCMDNVPELALTDGQQKRDFVYIDDVVKALELLLFTDKLSENRYLDVELGSGVAYRVKEFVEMVKEITESKTNLNFGAVESRKNEPSECCANIDLMKSFGWAPTVALENGIRKVMEKEYGQ